MPKTPIDEAPAGPAMDAAVAEALGYECVCDEESLDCPIHCDDDPWTKRRYSTDIAAAWKLVERECMRLGWTEDWGVPYAACRQLVCEYGEKHPEAICRAFLKANGIEFVEVLE